MIKYAPQNITNLKKVQPTSVIIGLQSMSFGKMSIISRAVTNIKC